VPNSTNFTLNVKYNPGRLVPALGRCPAATRQGPLGQRQGHENRASQASHGVVPITLSSQCHTRTEMEVFAEKPRPTLERPPIAVRVRHPGEGQQSAPSGGSSVCGERAGDAPVWRRLPTQGEPCSWRRRHAVFSHQEATRQYAGWVCLSPSPRSGTRVVVRLVGREWALWLAGPGRPGRVGLRAGCRQGPSPAQVFFLELVPGTAGVAGVG
jgi:hypothetical protein